MYAFYSLFPKSVRSFFSLYFQVPLNGFAFNKLRPAAKFIEQMRNERCKQTKFRFPSRHKRDFFSFFSLYFPHFLYLSSLWICSCARWWYQFTEIDIVPLNLHLWGNYKIIFSLIFFWYELVSRFFLSVLLFNKICYFL